MFLGLEVVTLFEVNQFEFFLKMVKYDPLDVKLYKMSDDFEWLGDIVKFIMMIWKFGVTFLLAKFS